MSDPIDRITIVIAPPVPHSSLLRQVDQRAIPLPPYGAGCVAAHLRSLGRKVRIVDLRGRRKTLNEQILPLARPDGHARLSAYLSEQAEDGAIRSLAGTLFGLLGGGSGLFGFSVLSRRSLPLALLLAHEVKRRTGALNVLGGALITEYVGYRRPNRMERLMSDFPFVDHAVYGEGEHAFSALIDAIETGSSFAEVPNLVYRRDGAVSLTGRIPIPIDDMPVPDFAGLPVTDYRTGRDAARAGEAHLPYQITRGCPHRCSFCNFHLVNSGVEMKSSEKVVRELQEMSERYGLSSFYFCESKINLSKPYLEELCARIADSSLGIRWAAIASVNNMDPGLLEKVRRAGCYSLSWGVESGSDRLLRSMRKGFRAEAAVEALRAASALGIFNTVNIMTGFPHETKEDVERTLSLIRENEDSIADVRLHDFALAPHSPIYEAPEEFGVENIRFDYETPVGFSRVAFDETGGLKWEAKLESKRAAYERVRSALRGRFPGIPDADIPPGTNRREPAR